MAAASVGAGHHFCGFPDARAGRSGLGALGADHRLVQRGPVPVPRPVHGAVVHCLHLDGARPRVGRDGQRLVVQHRRCGADSAIGGAADEHRQGTSRAGRRDHRDPAAAITPVHVGPIRPARFSSGAHPASSAAESGRPGVHPAGRVHGLRDGMAEGIWSSVDPWQLVSVAAVATVLLAVVLAYTAVAGRLARLDRGDAIVLLFCGSKKSLASGLPMALVLSPRPQSD